MSKLPQSADELLARLFAIFPQYCAMYDGPIHDDVPSFHSVLIGFTSEFGGELRKSSEKQLRSFGSLVSEAVMEYGEPASLENAFATCFLEHLRQIHADRVLRPYLSRRARELITP